MAASETVNVARRTPNGIERDRTIEGDEPAAMSYRERDEVHVRQLPRPVDPGRIRDRRIEEADVIRPECVERTRAGLREPRQDEGTGSGFG